MKYKIRIISLYTMFCVMLTSIFWLDPGNSFAGSNEKGSEGTAKMNGIEIGKVAAAGVPFPKTSKISYDSQILTVDSIPVYWPEFYFWLNYIKKYYKAYHNLEKITDWSAEQNGMNLKEFFLSTAVGYACKDRAIEAKAKELGIGLSASDLAEIEKQRADNIRIYGSELEYLRIVSSMYVSEDVFKYLTKIDYLGNHLFERLYGAKGEKCSDKEVSAHVKEQGYMCAKYIFLSNNDSEGNELSVEKRSENYRLLEDIIARLDRSNAPLNLFDELMIKHGEDRAISGFPEGRLFVSGAMGQEFENAYLQLKENKYSGIVKADNGYYIILHVPISPDMMVDSSGNTLRYRIAYDYLFKNQIEDLSRKIKVTYEDAYYKIDVEGLPDN